MNAIGRPPLISDEETQLMVRSVVYTERGAIMGGVLRWRAAGDRSECRSGSSNGRWH